MKRRDFERILKDAGYQVLRSNGHTTWANSLGHTVAIPQSSEINKMMARRLLKEIDKATSSFSAQMGASL